MSINIQNPDPSHLVVWRMGSQQCWEFTDETAITVGRSSENDIRLAFPQVSRSHCVIFRLNGHWGCSNLGRSGIYIDGEDVVHSPLADRSVVQLGRLGPQLRICIPSTSTDAESPDNDEPVTEWLNELKSGNEKATLKIWGYYFESVVRMARRNLGSAPRRVADEEDVALSVFSRLFKGISSGKYPELSDRDSLWRLLVVMTSRRSIDQIQHARRKKRGAGLTRGDSGVYAKSDADSAIAGFDQLAGDEPTPEHIAMMAEETASYLSLLEDKTLMQVALWKLEGYSNQEIADKLSLNVRTIERRLKAIRQCWSDLIDNG